MVRKGLVLGVLFGVVLLASACSATQFITVKTTVPPQRDIPLHIKNVAVLEFTGHEGGREVVARKLEQELMNNQHYKLIERSEIAAVINEKQFQQTDLVETNPEFLEAMKIKSVQAIINGSVANFNVTENRGRDPHIERRFKEFRVVGYNKKGRPIREAVYENITVYVPWIRRDGNVNATFKMVDMGTGQILASVSKGGASSTGKVKGDAPLATESQLLERAALDAVVKFIQAVSVWTKVENIALKKAKGCKNGNTFAASGLYDKAEAEFRAAAQIKGNYGALYNLGLVLEAQGRYTEAEAAYDQALSVRPSDKEILTSMNRIKEKKVYEERLRKLRGM